MDLLQSVSVSEWPVGVFDVSQDCDIAVIATLAELVASGLFVGFEFSQLLERVAIRIEAASDVAGVADGAVAAASYMAIVDACEESLGLPKHSIRAQVGELASIAYVFGDAVTPTYGIKYVDQVPRFASYATVNGGTLALAVANQSYAPRPGPDQLVLTPSVYRAILGLAVQVGTDPSFYPSRCRDGVYELAAVEATTTSVALSSLPDGHYLLPGGCGCVVPKAVLVALLNAVWADPVLIRQRGYCYLRVIPPSQRQLAAKVLGEFPTVERLRTLYPHVYTWCSVDAKVTIVTDSQTRADSYHVASVGRLPIALDSDMRIGSDAVIPSHFASTFGRFERRLSEGAVVKRPPVARSHVRSPSIGTVPGLGSSPPSIDLEGVAAPPVFRLRPGAMRGTSATWVECEEPMAREWSDRLSAGPPLGHTVISSLVKSRSDDLPPVPVAEGGRVVVLPAAGTMGQRQVKWKDYRSPLPGWHIERMGAVSGHSVSSVPPIPGTMCRYEVTADDAFVVNTIHLPGHRSAFWSDGCVLFTRLSSGSVVWRLWHDASVVSLGYDFMSLFHGYHYPVIIPARHNRTRIVCLEIYGEDAVRGEVLYRALLTSSPGEGSVHLYLSDVVSSEPVVLTVTCPGLVQVSICGAVLPACGQSVSCIVDISSLTVGFAVSHSHRPRFPDAMVFEVRRTQSIAGRRARIEAEPGQGALVPRV